MNRSKRWFSWFVLSGAISDVVAQISGRFVPAARRSRDVLGRFHHQCEWAPN